MDTTAPQLAKELGLSLPAVHRALDAEGVARTGRGHARRVPEGVLDRLLAERGSTPTQVAPGSELRVLAALSRAPLGLPSARSVATQAGLSPTTASKTLHTLRDRRLISRVSSEFARGRAKKESRWTAATHSWPEPLRSAVRRTRLPRAQNTRTETTTLPRSLHHLFWNADVKELSPETDGSYMAGRLLESPDIRAWRWALDNISLTDIDKAMSRRGVNPRTRALVANWMHRD
ncbi:helix-turn-helix domain-containing protein [Herbiconiux moechotypicola]|uniref:HTH iclR-type domain-containing protein n=1 Tax=Herbiconiux moechotypicola TaxID=637393 RepID=A0ABN3D7G3_9MICO|nr:MarR family transcriptional regulator [Herbiconiux moechotypicola]MCS5728546.1 helix-turn-helix domain-containing protein [Herbiconiux moechotypicola]